mgnify:CR=1 FL=1
MGYNDDFNFQKTDEDLIYPIFFSSILSLFFSALRFYFSEQILSVLISSAVTIISFLAMIKFKLAKKNSLSIVEGFSYHFQ